MKIYNPYPVQNDYILSESFVSLIIGPIGSGKTLASVVKWHKEIYEQEPSKDGIRYSRAVVVRNTSVELRDTTIKSFEDWFGDTLKFNWANLTAEYIHDDVHAEILFRALDKPQDMKKLLSLEITFAYLNELRELPKEAIENVVSRLGRYPAVSSGTSATKPKLWADSNACDMDSWMYKKFFEDKPKSWALFLQPSGILEDGSINPEAENLDNLPPTYYTDNISGNAKDWIDVMVRVKFIPLQTGKPVYPEYNDTIHCVNQDKINPPSADNILYCGADNGRYSGFIIGTKDSLGRITVFDELNSEDIGAEEFGRIIVEYLSTNYKGYKHEIFLDPACNTRSQLDDKTHLLIWRNLGLNCRLTNTNSPAIVTEGVKKKLNTITGGRPSLIISDKCKKLRKGLNGAYQYRRINQSGERYTEKPDKGPYSHICNALEYLVDGLGGSAELISTTEPLKLELNSPSGWMG